MIRKATISDIPGIIKLLYQADKVHNNIRPDLFKSNTPKYSAEELEVILSDHTKPIFVYEYEGEVAGHAFCVLKEVKNDRLLQDIKTLYIDDICVDEKLRGRHIGKALYDYVLDFAKSLGCNNLTLNVWEGNDSAKAFYISMGMKVQKSGMEVML